MAEHREYLIQVITRACREHNLSLLDFDLYGQKGINRLARGFLTPPFVKDMFNIYKGQKEVTDRIKMTTYQYAAEFCGAKISLITEVPLFISEELTNSDKTCISRYDLELEILRQSELMLESFTKAWNELNKFPISKETQNWVPYYENLFDLAASKIDAGYRDADRFKGFYAKMNEIFELLIGKIEERLKIGVMGMRRLASLNDPKSLREQQHYRCLFEEAFEKYAKQLDYKPVRLADIINLQITAVIAGACANDIGLEESI